MSNPTQGQQIDDRLFKVVEEEPSFISQHPQSYVLPATVEEPESPDSDIADVKMKSSSWYEPERDRKCLFSPFLPRESAITNDEFLAAGVVVTSLDSSSESGSDVDDEDQDADFLVNADKDISISAALLEHIKRSANFPYIPPIPGSRADEKALVLFHPPTPSSFASTSVIREQPQSTHNINRADAEKSPTSFQQMPISPNFPDPDPNAMDVEML